MKIAITGTGGIGKTTLGKLISNYTSLEYIPDINDVVLNEMGYKSGGQLFEQRGQEGMIDWHMKAITAKIKSDIKRDNYIADKSVFDFGARWFARFYPEAKDKNHKIILASLKKGINLYDKIIFLPLDLEREVEDNKMRATNPWRRMKFNFVLKSLYADFGVDYQKYDFNISDSPEKIINDLELTSLWTK